MYMRTLKASDSLRIGGLDGDEEIWFFYEPKPLKAGGFRVSARIEEGEIKR